MPNAIKYKAGNLTGSLQKGNVALGVSGSFGPTSTTGWYNGPNPPTSGLYQIIETAASGDPEVYSPQNDAELIRFARWKGATGADTGSVAAVLAWVGTQTNLMAINFQYENIVTDGLVLNLDAGFVGSYPTTASTWYDLSGNNNSGSLINGPTFNSANSGSIVFDGSDDYVNCGNNSSLNAPNQITLSAWINGTYTSGGEYAVIDKGGISGHHFGVYQRKIILQTSSGYRQSNTTLNSNVWYNIVAVYNKTNVYFYLNSIADGVQALTGGLSAPADPIWISRYINVNPLSFSGKIAIAQIYNRILSAQEVLQNYNAQKARFGL